MYVCMNVEVIEGKLFLNGLFVVEFHHVRH